MLFVFLFFTLTQMFAQMCFTPANIPCMTLRITETSWHNRSAGFHNVDRYRAVGQKAFRRDGAVATHLGQSRWRNHLIPVAKEHRATVGNTADFRLQKGSLPRDSGRRGTLEEFDNIR